MKLKHRLSLYSVTSFSVAMLFFSGVIYFSYYAQMKDKEYQSLESKSLLAAIYYLEQDELSLKEHANVKTQLQKTISRTNIAVFDSLNSRQNGDMKSLEDISEDFLSKVRSQQVASFDSKDYFYNGIFYHDNEGDFVVVTRESKEDFSAQMLSLSHILLLVFLLGVVFIFLFSQYLSYIAYQPLVRIVNQIKKKDTQNFNEPLILTETYSEVEDLVKTYNHFISRIAETFNVQKNFIDYVSHELRTPITALLGTLEVTNTKRRTIQEYEAVITELKQYTSDLQETLDQMMLLSGAKTNFEFQHIRVDEVIWQLVENMVLYHQAKVEVDIRVNDQALLTMDGNDKLLELAIGNLLENAIKYSDNQPVKILFTEVRGRLQLSIMDQGIGISQHDLRYIRQNFYRGNNTQNYQGKGIGLSIANIIFTLHKIDMQIVSQQNGTTVILLF
ncbi:HAMP domain-containing sensor histidine kinase [Sphingobacterium paludis]|uniref:histidine kinase n=1 Tax=Sphingobacterium paludis TaxID=1476465 RepID=A0A4R7DBT9_9SPHI|nr:HAMP domain-containing sensor histidine kinase [Sphingobacterium paludis]TDS17374.1 signal transduction histidine kinase [Sphingobacterium paludis]